MTITPDSLAKGCSEHAEQSALFCWAANNTDKYPELKWMFAIPNGESRGADRVEARRVGGRLKAAGVKAGVWDIFLPVARNGAHGLFIEMKYGNNKLSDEQREFFAHINSSYYQTIVAWNWKYAAESIVRYLTGEIINV